MDRFDPFHASPETEHDLNTCLQRMGVPLPQGEGTLVLDLGADKSCPAGIQIAQTDFERVVGGLRLFMRALGESRAMLCCGHCFREQFRLLRQLLPSGDEIGRLLYACRGFEDPRRALERKLGPVRIVSAELCRAAFRAFYEEIPRRERLVSIQVRNKNHFVTLPFGGSTAECLALAGIQPEEGTLIVLGSPMTAPAVTEPEAPLDDTVDALVLLAPKKAARPSPCIRCGSCYKVCPMGLRPWRLIGGKKLDLSACTQCGACTYVCPARLPLAERIREEQAEQEVAEIE